MTNGQQSSSPADALAGMQLDEGWQVGNRIARVPGATGGHFSVCYEVTNASMGTNHPLRTGILKAFDYSSAADEADPLRSLEIMAAEFNFERDIVQHCNSKKMRHVVVGLADGEVILNGYGPLLNRVPYIILEAADGDIRSTMQFMANIDLAWIFQTLHNVANGLRTLHQSNIIHQDIKPSNILDFGTARKVGDLGRAYRVGVAVPHDDLVTPGDFHYAPPEQLYGWTQIDRRLQRLAGDLYQLGNLMCFILLEASATTLLLSRIDPTHWPASYNGTYEDILPELRDSFGYILESIALAVPVTLRDIAVGVFRELTDPDIKIRGAPKRRLLTQARFSVERYVSRFDNLATRCRFLALGGSM